METNDYKHKLTKDGYIPARTRRLSWPKKSVRDEWAAILRGLGIQIDVSDPTTARQLANYRALVDRLSDEDVPAGGGHDDYGIYVTANIADAWDRAQGDAHTLPRGERRAYRISILDAAKALELTPAERAHCNEQFLAVCDE